MLVSVFVAHLLAAHLSVPELVTVQYAELRHDRVAQIEKVGRGWVMTIDKDKWHGSGWVVAHELCHAAYDDRYSTTAIETRANKCADQVIRDHMEGR